ncbi:PilZ domain-containing protein [Pueribacillus theae]|uniref:PilZ domain-containing protein n=1 Tax=Pueribacillus theae TaxID=2171751 RepID=A0A2U1K5G9_9BACI|nr:PilZ domain-containing protein [Pueribacillus theae]
MEKSLANMQFELEIVKKNRAFRLKLFEQECIFELIDFGDKLLEGLKHKTGKGKILDISHTGMKLNSELNFPVRKEIFLQLYFELQKEKFSLKGKIVRKEEFLNDFSYGIQFIGVNPVEEQRLYMLIQKIEIEKRSK